MTKYDIGRDYDYPIRIDDKATTVSHNHATIIIEGDNWTLIDNKSSNGTYVEIDGEFRRIDKISIRPDTWIRLGEAGIAGHTFKARRVLKPDSYKDDFNELLDVYRQYEKAVADLSRSRSNMKFLTPILTGCALLLSLSSFVGNDPIALRAVIALPGLLMPFLQSLLLQKKEKTVKALKSKLICPKCRREMSKYDIEYRSHPVCKAY